MHIFIVVLYDHMFTNYIILFHLGALVKNSKTAEVRIALFLCIHFKAFLFFCVFSNFLMFIFCYFVIFLFLKIFNCCYFCYFYFIFRCFLFISSIF